MEISLSPAYGDSIVETSNAGPVILNPILCPDSVTRRTCGLIFSGLVKEGPELNMLGDLADTWEISLESREITFHLKKNVRWHDAAPFNAWDVLFTYQKIADPKTQTYDRENFSQVKTVEVIDPDTVRVRYDNLTPAALEAWSIGIIPRHLFLNEDINTSKYNQQAIGTGPFRLKNWEPQTRVVLEANLDYFNGRPYADRYILKIIPDPSMQFLELLKENVDIFAITTDQFIKQADTPEFTSKFNVFRYPQRVYNFLSFNLLNPFFQDRKVRQALCLATDRQKIIDNALYGMGTLITGPFPPFFWAYDKSVKPWPYDPEKARQMLNESGWKDTDSDGILERDGKKFQVEIVTNNGNDTRKLAACMIRDYWKDVGVSASVRFVDWNALMDICDYKSYDTMILGWSHNVDPDPYRRWHSSQMPDKEKGKMGDNFMSYSNPEVDRLLEEARKITDQAEREKMYHRFHQILADEQPYIFIYATDMIYAVHKRIHGIKLEPAGIRYNFENWYVPKQYQKYGELE
ncbi:MAG: peptide-binding protein [Candidatus Wallbacteria bacterium]|nr:peptide-binding protein [Candidatus Wallbacteria bacterium]